MNLEVGARVRVVNFDPEGITGLIYTGEADPRGKYGVVSEKMVTAYRVAFDLPTAYRVTFDLPNAPFFPGFFYESELEVIDETG